MSDNKVIMWEGTPLHLINIDTYFFWTLFLLTILFLATWNDTGWLNLVSKFPEDVIKGVTIILMGIPVWKIMISYLTVKNTNYQLTEERLITKKGILSREIDEMELYRVKDYQINSPFFQRIFSLGTIVLDTSDKSDPFLSLNAVKNPEKIRDMLRTQVEALRLKKGVREIDH